MPFQSPLFMQSNRSNRRAKHGSQTAFEERGEVKLQSLSPRMHLSPPQRRGGRARGRVRAGSSAGLGLRTARCAAAGGRGARRRRALEEDGVTPSCPLCRAAALRCPLPPDSAAVPGRRRVPCSAPAPSPPPVRASSSSVEIREATAPRLVGPSDPQVHLPRRCLDLPPPEKTRT